MYLGIFGLRPCGEVFPKAKMAAERALELDDRLPKLITLSQTSIHNALADIHKDYEWDWSSAKAEYRRALELNPSSSPAHAWYSDYLSKLRRSGH